MGQPALSHPHLFSSLPDVSSVGHRSASGTVGDGACKPAESESLHLRPTGTAPGHPEVPQLDKDVNSEGVKLEMDARFKRNHRKVNQTIPDCIVESVMNEEHQGDEMPVAFSETIGQRARRERPSRRSCFDNLEPADLVKDASRSDRKVGDTERTKEEEAQRSEPLVHGGEQGSAEVDFTGDWPSGGILEQRPARRGERRNERNGETDEAAAQQSSGTQNGLPSGADITEFQKLLDLIQTGVADIQMEDFTPSSLSSSSEEDLESNKEEADRCGSSDGKENEENAAANHNQGELPDFVLDQKMSDKSCNAVVALMDDWGVLKTDNEVKIIKEGDNEAGSLALKSASTSPLIDFHIRPLALSETVEPSVSRDGEEELVTTLIDLDDSKQPCARFGADGSENSESCSSPVCESSVGGGRERKQRQGRRPGKQCKLALTFPQNCPSPSADHFSAPVNTKCCQEMSHTNVEHLNTESKTSGEPNSDLSTHSSSKAEPRLPSPLLPVGVREAASSQTEAQDFAFLWRLGNQNSLDEEFIATYSQLHDIVVLSGNSSRFEVSAAVPTLVHKEVPYHVVHDKSTQIEDKDLGLVQDRLESLRILSRHFKLVSFDTLADLYDKCHQDLDWTTNLLLDSGEIFFKEEDGDHALKDGAGGKGREMEPGLENTTRPDVIEEPHNEHQPVELEERAVHSAAETLPGSGQSSSNLSGGHFETTLADKGHPETAPLSETPPQAEHRAANAGAVCAEHEEEVGSEVDQDSGAWGGSWDDGLIVEEATIETENELASMEAVNALLQAEIKRIEEEEKEKEVPRRRHMGAGRSQHLDIQSVELKLPTEVALQLIELFGPVGANPGTCHRK